MPVEFRAGADSGGVVLARLDDALADRQGVSQSAVGCLCAERVLDCGGAVCIRAWAVLGGGTGGWDRLQLVDDPDEESGGLYACSRGDECGAVGIRTTHGPVAVLAVTP